MVHFIILVLLWFFRDPVIFPGWASRLTDDKKVITVSVAESSSNGPLSPLDSKSKTQCR